MGRKKKYHTETEKREAKAKQWKLYYDKNKEKINGHRMKKYYKDKEGGNREL